MKIKELRKEKKQTQIEIAKQLGVSQQVFANYENEINYPDPKMLIKIADFFDVTVDYLIGRTDDFGVIKKQTPGLSLDEADLIENYRKCDNVGRVAIYDVARSLANVPQKVK